MNLPESITAYFEAANAGDGQAAAASFAEDAIVHDEDAEHRGRQAIRTWVEESTRKYHARLEALSSRESDGHTVVTCRVAGDFPGSPIELDFDFTLANGAIASLRIS